MYYFELHSAWILKKICIQSISCIKVETKIPIYYDVESQHIFMSLYTHVHVYWTSFISIVVKLLQDLPPPSIMVLPRRHGAYTLFRSQLRPRLIKIDIISVIIWWYLFICLPRPTFVLKMKCPWNNCELLLIIFIDHFPRFHFWNVIMLHELINEIVY